ncbi:IS5 family transposase [Streptomyces sp. NPDC097610]|uniref:IS5 family transposase n=1 Tax=Streptomyces sp. NPDC097610 TaxID=3157227 RepID=UPI00331A825E
MCAMVPLLPDQRRRRSVRADSDVAGVRPLGGGARGATGPPCFLDSGAERVGLAGHARRVTVALCPPGTATAPERSRGVCRCDNSEAVSGPCCPSSPTDEMWEVIRPLLPVRNLRKGGGVRKYGDRLVLDSIFYVLRSGCQWRMLPRDPMPWDAAHRWFTKWRRDGSWDRIQDELRRQLRIGAGRDPESSAAVIDAQSIKTSEGGEARGFDAGERTTGRMRHVIVDTMGLLLVVAVTSASVQDRAGGRTVLARLAAAFRTVSLVWAGGGYANSVDSTLLSWARDALGIVVEIVKRTDDVGGFKVLPRRWVVERSFGWLVPNRWLARHYERRTATSEAMIKVAMIRLILVRLAGQSSRWSHESHRKTARTKTTEDLIVA